MAWLEVVPIENIEETKFFPIELKMDFGSRTRTLNIKVESLKRGLNSSTFYLFGKVPRLLSPSFFICNHLGTVVSTLGEFVKVQNHFLLG